MEVNSPDREIPILLEHNSEMVIGKLSFTETGLKIFEPGNYVLAAGYIEVTKEILEMSVIRVPEGFLKSTDREITR